MSFEKNTFTPPKKSFDEMTPQEVDELLDRLIQKTRGVVIYHDAT